MSENIFDGYEEVNKLTYYSELRKVRSRLLTIAIILFLSDVLGLVISDMLTVQLLLWSLVIPAIIAALALLAFKEPLAAMIIATVIVAALWIYIIAMTGLLGAFSGFLVKGIVIYLLITGITSAKNAQRLKKELGNNI
jgi:hypothetical protein